MRVVLNGGSMGAFSSQPKLFCLQNANINTRLRKLGNKFCLCEALFVYLLAAT
jgi:hypothetical protein